MQGIDDGIDNGIDARRTFILYFRTFIPFVANSVLDFQEVWEKAMNDEIP